MNPAEIVLTGPNWISGLLLGLLWISGLLLGLGLGAAIQKQKARRKKKTHYVTGLEFQFNYGQNQTPRTPQRIKDLKDQLEHAYGLVYYWERQFDDARKAADNHCERVAKLKDELDECKQEMQFYAARADDLIDERDALNAQVDELLEAERRRAFTHYNETTLRAELHAEISKAIAADYTQVKAERDQLYCDLKRQHKTNNNLHQTIDVLTNDLAELQDLKTELQNNYGHAYDRGFAAGQAMQRHRSNLPKGPLG